MKLLATIILLAFFVSAFGQRLPNQFPQKNTAEAADELYTQASGTAYRIILDSVRMFMAPDIDLLALTYDIDSSGTNIVDSLRGRFVLDNSGDWWYVDKDKTALLVVAQGVGGNGVAASDTSRHSHTRLTFGNSYSLPLATLDTADIISVYGGALGAHVTITLPTLPDTSYDGKIIYVRGSATGDGTHIMRVTSTDSSDVLVQGCQSMTVQEITPTDSTNIDIALTSYANTSGPDTITTSMGELRMYIISNGKYYRYCQYRQPVPRGAIFQIDMTTAATSTTVDFNAPTAAENGGVYTFHFQNTDSNDVDFPDTFKNQAGVLWDSSTTYTMSDDFFMTCYYDGTDYNCK